LDEWELLVEIALIGQRADADEAKKNG